MADDDYEMRFTSRDLRFFDSYANANVRRVEELVNKNGLTAFTFRAILVDFLVSAMVNADEGDKPVTPQDSPTGKRGTA
jgi:hypothetical protein